MAAYDSGEIGDAELAAAYDQAIRDTIQRLEQTGSPVVSDGEQAKPSFATYPLAGLANLGPGAGRGIAHFRPPRSQVLDDLDGVAVGVGGPGDEEPV